MVWRDAGLGAGTMLLLLLPGVGYLLRAASTPPPPVPAPTRREAAPAAQSGASARSASEALHSELAAAERANSELQTRISWLEYQLEHPEAASTTGPAAAPNEDFAQAEAQVDLLPLRFDAEALRATGVPFHEVDHLREVFDASELDLLELGNTARREGWIDTPRYLRELYALRAELRSELGDDDFDRLLYATGRPNRVVVNEVLSGSPAEDWGLLPGDLILRYDDTRVFRGRELQIRSSEGLRGDRVSIDILRAGQDIRLYGERGPLGIRLQLARHPTEENP